MPHASADSLRDLETLLKRRVPLVVIETRDEPHALALLTSLSTRISAQHTRSSNGRSLTG
ncbi:MAG TPA: hypothetical protein VK025_15170 [Steroidobacter sp.]|nr:hypothetical protein [Steroidobacter sp.]